MVGELVSSSPPKRLWTVTVRSRPLGFGDAFANVDGVWKRCVDVVNENAEFEYTRSVSFESGGANNV